MPISEPMTVIKNKVTMINLRQAGPIPTAEDGVHPYLITNVRMKKRPAPQSKIKTLSH